MTEIQKDEWGCEFPGKLARARNLAKDLEPLAPKMREYLSTLKEEGYDIHERCVDWTEAAKRWAIMHQHDPNFGDLCYDGIYGDINCRKYESFKVPPVTITIGEAEIRRICRGGDCRGEPYIYYTRTKFVHCAYSQLDLYVFLLKVGDFCKWWETCYNHLWFDAYNGYSYYLEDGIIYEHATNEKREWVNTGKIIIKEDETGNYELVSDTTHLFNRPIRWVSYEQLTDEEKERRDRYTDDGCDN